MVKISYTRPICPKCQSKQILEIKNKDKILYYSMQGTPVYAMQLKCGMCGHIFEKDAPKSEESEEKED